MNFSPFQLLELNRIRFQVIHLIYNNLQLIARAIKINCVWNQCWTKIKTKIVDLFFAILCINSYRFITFNLLAYKMRRIQSPKQPIWILKQMCFSLLPTYKKISWKYVNAHSVRFVHSRSLSQIDLIAVHEIFSDVLRSKFEFCAPEKYRFFLV